MPTGIRVMWEAEDSNKISHNDFTVLQHSINAWVHIHNAEKSYNVAQKMLPYPTQNSVPV